MRFFATKSILGIIFLLVAAFLLLNQYYNFTDIGIGSLVISVIAIFIIINCIARFQFAFLPIPLAVLYIIFQDRLNLPAFQTWTLILAAILASVGLQIIFPIGYRKIKFKNNNKPDDQYNQANTADTDENNNHFFKVNFGAISRRLHSNNLENVKLECNFGAMEIFFDKVQLSPNGAEVSINCRFGAVVLCIPKEWRIVDNLNCSLGGIDISKSSFSTQENAPVLKISGDVSLGGIEIKPI